ncbi:hypothetical protein JCM5353_007654 [Sporobolomyces roseus]
MAPKRKAPAASSSTATKKTTTRSSTKKQAPPPSSDSESDDSPPPVKKKKTTTTAATKAKPKPKAKAPVKSTSTKGKKKQEEIILSDTSDEQDELDSQSESEDEPVKPKKAAKGKGKATATTKKVEPEKKKSKSKPKVEYTSEPESEDDDVVIQEPVPKSKKKATVSKKASTTSTSTKSKSKLKANSPPSTPSEHTPIPSTSSKLSKSSKSKKRAPSPPPKPVPFEVALKKWFEPFAEKGEEGEREKGEGELMMGGDGIEKLFEEMELSMEGVYPFLLAWDLKAQPGTFGSFSYNDFENTLRPLNIRTSSELSSHLTSLESTLYPSTPASPSSSIASIDLPPAAQKSFSSFYSFLFPFLKPDGSKSLPPQLAIPVLSVALAPKYKLGKEFVEYAESLGEGFKSVSGDVWGMLLEFIETVGEDLKGWNEMDAWPSTIDNFVQWKKDKDEKEKMNATTTA